MVLLQGKCLFPVVSNGQEIYQISINLNVRQGCADLLNFPSFMDHGIDGLEISCQKEFYIYIIVIKIEWLNAEFL